MKSRILLLLQLFTAVSVSAQLSITPGTQFSIAGNLQLTLQNTDLVNNGSFTAGNSMISFTGNTASSIAGNQPVQFDQLEMNKTNNASVVLLCPMAIAQRILFTSGFLNLNGFDTDLGTAGHLDGEQENSHVTGTQGGQVLFSTVLNAPAGSNPGNLGAIISSAQNLGSVTIKRGHQSQVNGLGLGNSILRYYDIVPANNTGLNATLRFQYLDAELNGLDENAIVLFESQNPGHWTSLGVTSRDVIINFAEKTGISTFGRFTLSSAANALPVGFTVFNATCEGNKVQLSWTTAQEHNSDHFHIERNDDGTHWKVIGNLSAAGNSNHEIHYSFTDNAPIQNSLYRLVEYDLDGKLQYSGIIRSSCTVTDVFRLWPNPAQDVLYINIVSDKDAPAFINIFDGKGALIKTQSANVLWGSNQLRVDIKSLATGMYAVSVKWDNGHMKKTVQVIKQ